jgi:hypothetical protein
MPSTDLHRRFGRRDGDPQNPTVGMGIVVLEMP